MKTMIIHDIFNHLLAEEMLYNDEKISLMRYRCSMNKETFIFTPFWKVLPRKCFTFLFQQVYVSTVD